MSDLPRPRLPMRAEPLPKAFNPVETCVVCGRGWQPAGGTLLPCHARCLFTPEDQDRLLELSERAPHAGKFCEAVGVSRGVLAANLACALERRSQQWRER